MGSSSAYFLANRMAPEMGRICVIEQDPTVREKFLIVILFIQLSRCTYTGWAEA